MHGASIPPSTRAAARVVADDVTAAAVVSLGSANPDLQRSKRGPVLDTLAQPLTSKAII